MKWSEAIAYGIMIGFAIIGFMSVVGLYKPWCQ